MWLFLSGEEQKMIGKQMIGKHGFTCVLMGGVLVHGFFGTTSLRAAEKKNCADARPPKRSEFRHRHRQDRQGHYHQGRGRE